MSELIARFVSRASEVVIPGGGDRPAAVLGELIDEGVVPVRFVGGEGETELDVELDLGACVLDAADFVHGTGTARLVGRLTLDDVPIRVVADVELGAMSGWARVAVCDAPSASGSISTGGHHVR